MGMLYIMLMLHGKLGQNGKYTHLVVVLIASSWTEKMGWQEKAKETESWWKEWLNKAMEGWMLQWEPRKANGIKLWAFCKEPVKWILQGLGGGHGKVMRFWWRLLKILWVRNQVVGKGDQSNPCLLKFCYPLYLFCLLIVMPRLLTLGWRGGTHRFFPFISWRGCKY